MSLAVLARKTKTRQRLRSTKCNAKGGGRSVGFVLNMTGRGGGIGLSGMSYKQRGLNCRKTPANMGYQGKVNTGCQCKGCCSGGGRCKTGQAGTCCAGDQRVSKKCRDDCGLCWYGGLSQPAPQMSYRNYINRKANGAYRPGGSVCCDEKSDCTNPKSNKCLKPKVTWKQSPNIAASTITEHRAQATVRCVNNIIKRNPVYLNGTLLSNRITAKPVCSWYNPETCKYETVIGPNPLLQNCQCSTNLPIKGRLGYTRINKKWCNTTKTLTVGTSSSEQIAKRKQRAFLCPCPVYENPQTTFENTVTIVADYKSAGAIDQLFLINSPTTLIADSFNKNQAGLKGVCKKASTLYIIPDVGSLPAAQALLLTAAFPSKANGGVDADGYYSDTGFANYLQNHPELIIAAAFDSNGFIDISFPIKFTSKQLGELCKLGYKQLYLIDTSNGPFPADGNGVLPITWNIDCCSDCCENQKRETARYCYPRPFHTGKNCGLSLGLTRLQKEACRLGCPKYWNAGNLLLR